MPGDRKALVLRLHSTATAPLEVSSSRQVSDPTLPQERWSRHIRDKGPWQRCLCPDASDQLGLRGGDPGSSELSLTADTVAFLSPSRNSSDSCRVHRRGLIRPCHPGTTSNVSALSKPHVGKARMHQLRHQQTVIINSRRHSW